MSNQTEVLADIQALLDAIGPELQAQTDAIGRLEAVVAALEAAGVPQSQLDAIKTATAQLVASTSNLQQIAQPPAPAGGSGATNASPPTDAPPADAPPAPDAGAAPTA